MTHPDDRQSKNENAWVDTLKTIGLSVILAFGIRVSVAESFFIPSGSMEPTLQVGDRLIVDKLSYRFNHPKRGDVVVFSANDQTSAECGLPQDSHYYFIKRVIGLPGEKIEVKKGAVYVNDRPLRENYLADKPHYQWGPKTVPQQSYLVLGDNRNNSCDSHYWGFVSRDRILGRAFLRFYPMNRIDTFSHAQQNSHFQTQ
jgi:signal peptidase I